MIRARVHLHMVFLRSKYYSSTICDWLNPRMQRNRGNGGLTVSYLWINPHAVQG